MEIAPELAAAPPENDRNTKVGRSSSVDRLCVEVAPEKPARGQWTNLGHESSTSLSMALGGDPLSSTPRGEHRQAAHQRKAQQPHENMFDVQGGHNKLTNLLQNGYSYKHQEKRKHGKTPKNLAGMPMLPASGMSVNMGREIKYGMRCETVGNSPPSDDSGTAPTAEQNFAAAVALSQEGPAGNLSAELASMVHSGSHVGGGLRSVLGNAEQIDKMKKLHKLYAAQRGKCK